MASSAKAGYFFAGGTFPAQSRHMITHYIIPCMIKTMFRKKLKNTTEKFKNGSFFRCVITERADQIHQKRLESLAGLWYHKTV